MPSKFPTVRISPFLGINKADDKYNLKTGDLLQADNVSCNNDGSVDRVDGYVDLFTSLGSAECLSIYEWKRYDGSRDIVFLYNATLYIIANYGNSPSYVALGTGFTHGRKIRYVGYNDYLYLGNTTEANKIVLPSPIHKALTTVVSTANATDLASVKTLFNALKAAYNAHIAITTYHAIADVTNATSGADLAGGDSQATTNTRVNEIKADYNNHRDETDTHTTSDDYHTVTAAGATDEATSVTLVNQIKAVVNQHFQSSRISDWGITPPATAPTGAASAGAGLEVGVYQYCYTYYDKNNGIESAPSLIDSTTTAGGNLQVTLTDFVASTDAMVTHIRIYRTFVDGGTFYRISESSNHVTSYTDSTSDNDLGVALATEDTSIIPKTSIFVLCNDRIYMSGDYTAPYRVYFTEPTYPTMYKAAFNYQDFDVGVTGIATIPSGMLIFEKTKTWIWLSPPFGSAPKVLSPMIGCVNAESICYIDGLLVYEDKLGRQASLESPIVWQSGRGVFASNGNVPVCISEKLGTDYQNGTNDSAVTVLDAAQGRLYVIKGG